MANNVLKEELVLNSSQFDKNVNNVIKKVEELKHKGKNVGHGFDSSMGRMIQRATGFNGSLGSLIGVVGKFAGALGVAMSAGELFNRMMTESQAVGDGVARIQNQAGEAVNFFASAMAHVEFDNFLDGLRNVIKLAGEAADAIDEATSIATRFGWSNRLQQAKFNRAMSIARNPDYSREERQQALEDARKISSAMTAGERIKAEAERKKARKVIETELAKVTYNGAQADFSKLTDEQFYSYFSPQGYLTNKKYAKPMIDAINIVNNRGWDIATGYRGAQGVMTPNEHGAYRPQEEQKKYRLAKAEAEKYSKSGKYLAAYQANEINDTEDSNLREALETYAASYELLYQQEARQKDIGTTSKRINRTTQNLTHNRRTGGNARTGRNADAESATTPVYNAEQEVKRLKELLSDIDLPFVGGADVINDINKNISYLNEQLKYTVTGSKEWLNITNQIKEETKKLRDYQDGSLSDLENQIAEIDKRLKNENLSIPTRMVLQDKKDELQAKIDELSDDAYITVTPIVGDRKRRRNSISNAQTNVDNIVSDYNSGLLDFSTAQSQIDEINEQLHQLGLEPIKVHLETDAQKKANEIADAVGNIGGAFSQLGSSLQMPQLDVAGTIAGAVASVIEGYGKATSQAASLGPWAWVAFSLAGLAQVAAIVAQIHSLSSYANGGVVGGSQYAGDALLARVNSGEMILTGSQQKNLFNLIDKGGTSNISGGNVNFVIRGNDLHGVLENYNSKMKKVR